MTIICDDCENGPVELGATVEQLKAAAALVEAEGSGQSRTAYIGMARHGLLPVRVYMNGENGASAGYRYVLFDKDVFHPAPNTLYNRGCMRDICEYIDDMMSKRRKELA